MRKTRIVSAAVSAAMLSSAFAGLQIMTANATGIEDWTANTTGTPQYHTTQRQMEALNRGVVASYISAADGHAWNQKGVYLSWRLLGDENLTDQAFDIYRNGTKIYTTGPHDATNYVDSGGTAASEYIVVKAGESIFGETPVKPTANYTAKGSEVTNGNSEINSFTYVDIPISRPAPVARMGDGKLSYYYSYDSSHEGGANDASVGDLDGDGNYEIVLKWDPTDSKDSAGADFTGRVYIDAYEIDPNNDGYMWRIDLGPNVTAGQHYTQYIVYDFDGDGRSEVAMQTAPGSVDGQGHYVSEVGDTEEIRNVDNTKSYIGTSGHSKGKNLGPEYYTIFDGETGAAISTTAAIPLVSSGNWGDSIYNRSMRFLAGVAYLDGVHPSLIECRGYYARVVIRAYSFDGESLSMEWEYNSGASGLYSEGFHNLGIADIDNDGYDEIVYGSACLDQDGQTVLGDTNLGHGDAQHTSDFNNDGIQESYVVHEEKKGYVNYAGQFKVTATGQNIWSTKATDDTGRGVMDNIDDDYAKTHPNALALGWDSSNDYTYDFTGTAVAAKPTAGSKTMTNFLVYWDGDLSRELLDGNIICKYHADTGYTTRFYGPTDGYSLTGGASNNYSKATPSLCADIWGDWREEVILPINKSSASEQAYLRIYTSTIPTDYRLTTLMHDAQYRCSVAWQNVGYNQPTHQSYYIGSASLVKDSDGNTLNYLAPATLFTSVGYDIGQIDLEGLDLSAHTLTVEKGKTEALTTVITPVDATRKAVIWTSSDPSVATVSGGTVRGVNPGTATITATSKYFPKLSASCEVTVWSVPVEGITVDESVSIGIGCSKQITASVLPENASDQKVTWTSSNTAVATVDENGKVTGNTTGAVLITATTEEDGFTASCVVNIVPLEETDITGDNVFITPSDGNGTTYKTSATGATITQIEATTGAETYRTVEKLTDNHAHLSLRFYTAGKYINGTSYNWDGHEYTLGLQLLGADDQNILTLEQPYRTTAEALTSKIGSNDAENFATDWNTIVDKIGNIQGSSKRWFVDVDFDYDNSTATATLTAANSDWTVADGQYTKTFDLNGLSLENVRYYTTVDGEGYITTSPQLSELSYTQLTPVEGATDTLYEKGTQWYNAWTAEDTADWTRSNADVALNYSASAAENGRIYFSEEKPGVSYSALKTFDVDDNALLTYDVDWYFGSSTSRGTNFEYLQFGNKLRIGWTFGFKTFVSTDGGETYPFTLGEDGKTIDDDSASIFNGANASYTKHVQAIFDVRNNVLKSLKFDGTEIYANYQLEEDATVDSVSFGFQRGGATDSWEYPNGLDSILVSQFVEGKEVEVPTAAPTPTPSPTPKPTATPAPSMVPVEHDVTAFTVYNSGRVTVSAAEGDENEITFTNASNANNGFAGAYADISAYVDGKTGYDVEFDSYVTSDSRARIALVDAAQRPADSNKNAYNTTGVAYFQGVISGSDYCVNGDKSTGNAPGARDAYVHTKVSVDAVNQTVSYKVTDVTGATILSGTDVAYLDDITINGIEFFDIINDVAATMKNIKVITYELEEDPTPTPDTESLTIDVTSPKNDEEGKIRIKITNKGTKAQPVKLLVASYDEENRLIGLSLSEDATAEAGGSAEIAADAPETEKFKVLLWNTTNSLVPLMTPITGFDEG